MITCIGLDSSFEKAINITNGNLEVFFPIFNGKIIFVIFFYIITPPASVDTVSIVCLFVFFPREGQL